LRETRKVPGQKKPALNSKANNESQREGRGIRIGGIGKTIEKEKK